MNQKVGVDVRAAVVVPTHTTALDSDGACSIALLERHLGKFDRFLVLPDGTRPLDGFRVHYLPREFFSSSRAMNKLMLRREFYERFQDYTHILIYQTDCLVLSDRLLFWCKKGYDFVGAPWINPDTNLREARCGNGGFSLRNVQSSLTALAAARASGRVPKLRTSLFRDPLKVTMKRAARPTTIHPDRFDANEDHWWSYHAAYFDPTFVVAPARVALDFAFETAPARCYELNGRRLPFGCHAWSKYDRQFWLSSSPELGQRLRAA